MNGAGLTPWWWMLGALVGLTLALSTLRHWLATRAVRSARHEDARLTEPLPAAQVPSSLSQDPLTGLASRLWLEDRLAAAVLRAETQQRHLALLYIDLDGFKPINDSFGYDSGDGLLREAADRLRRMGRSTDTIARMGADEFLMLLDGDPDSTSAALVADRVRAALQAPYLVDGKEVLLSCSIGIVLFPEHGPRAKLIARADAAMLAAKLAGGNMHCFFDARMDHDAEGAIALQRDLRQALDSNEGLSLHYQPKIDGRSGELVGVEALLRWQHPARGMVSPAVFVPVAERFGLIGALGQWVIQEACRQVRLWLDEGLRIHVAINLSVYQLRQRDLVERVQETLLRHGVPAEWVCFEVTESAAMEDAQASLRLFERLAQIGVALSIDDFGTGYSSLSHLRKLPARQLKIDRSFVQDVDQEEDARAIVRAVIHLAHALGMRVVAEGVETAAQQTILLHMGCDELQGYLYAKPMPPAQLREWMAGAGVPWRDPAFLATGFNQEARDAAAAQASRVQAG
jgi:diguanylate cyclase (GGDEF)-like protein